MPEQHTNSPLPPNNTGNDGTMEQNHGDPYLMHFSDYSLPRHSAPSTEQEAHTGAYMDGRRWNDLQPVLDNILHERQRRQRHLNTLRARQTHMGIPASLPMDMSCPTNFMDLSSNRGWTGVNPSYGFAGHQNMSNAMGHNIVTGNNMSTGHNVSATQNHATEQRSAPSSASANASSQPVRGTESLLHVACKDDSTPVHVLKFLLNNDSCMANAYDQNGWIPLHYAIQQCNIEKVNCLLEANPGTVNTSTLPVSGKSDTPLTLAVECVLKNPQTGMQVLETIKKKMDNSNNNASAEEPSASGEDRISSSLPVAPAAQASAASASVETAASVPYASSPMMESAKNNVSQSFPIPMMENTKNNMFQSFPIPMMESTENNMSQSFTSDLSPSADERSTSSESIMSSSLSTTSTARPPAVSDPAPAAASVPHATDPILPKKRNQVPQPLSFGRIMVPAVPRMKRSSYLTQFENATVNASTAQQSLSVMHVEEEEDKSSTNKLSTLQATSRQEPLENEESTVSAEDQEQTEASHAATQFSKSLSSAIAPTNIQEPIKSPKTSSPRRRSKVPLTAATKKIKDVTKSGKEGHNKDKESTINANQEQAEASHAATQFPESLSSAIAPTNIQEPIKTSAPRRRSKVPRTAATKKIKDVTKSGKEGHKKNEESTVNAEDQEQAEASHAATQFSESLSSAIAPTNIQEPIKSPKTSALRRRSKVPPTAATNKIKDVTNSGKESHNKSDKGSSQSNRSPCTPTSKNSQAPKESKSKAAASTAASASSRSKSSTISAMCILEMCKESKWKELHKIIQDNPEYITMILKVEKESNNDENRNSTSNNNTESKGMRTTTILHQILRSRCTDLSGRISLLNGILRSPLARQACAIRSEPLGVLPLHVALYRDNKMDARTREQIVSVLVHTYPEAAATQETSSSPTIKKTGGKTPLHIMGRQYSSTNVAKILIVARPEAARIRDDKGWLPIHHACRWRSSPEKLKLLIDAYPESVMEKSGTGKNGEEGKLPLELVVADATKDRPHLALISMLKEKMTEMKDRNRGGEAEQDNERAILPEQPDMVFSNSNTTSGNDNKIVEIFARDKPSMKSNALPAASAVPKNAKRLAPTTGPGRLLMSLCNADDWVGIEEYIRKQPTELTKINGKSSQSQQTVLHKAFSSSSKAYDARVRTVEMILSVAPQLASFKSECGSLPLHFAMKNLNQFQIDTTRMECLISSLIKSYPQAVVIKDHEEHTPLHIACMRFCSPALLRILLNAGPQAVRMKDAEGFLPIHLACQQKCPSDKLEMLLNSYPESILVKTNSGYTPLSLANKLSGKSNQNDSTALVSNELEPVAQSTVTGEENQGISEGQQLGAKSTSRASSAMKVPGRDMAKKGPPLDMLNGVNVGTLKKRKMEGNSNATTAKKPRGQLKSCEESDNSKQMQHSNHYTCCLHPAVEDLCKAKDWAKVVVFVESFLKKIRNVEELGTILHCALECNNNYWHDKISLIKLVLQICPSAASVINRHCGSMPLHVALINSEMDDSTREVIVSKLIESCRSAVTVQNNAGQTPLHVACANRCSPPVINSLLDISHAASAMRDTNGWFPLHHLCRNNGGVEQAKMLICANPSSVYSVTNTGESPVTLTISGNIALDNPLRIYLLSQMYNSNSENTLQQEASRDVSNVPVPKQFLEKNGKRAAVREPQLHVREPKLQKMTK